MSDKQLVVLLSGEKLGTLTEDHHGKHWFAYDLDGPERSLSLSMPRRLQPWGPQQVEPFLDGLLPDNQAARNEIARLYDAVAGNTFSLLAAVGRDCAGAVQFLPPDKADKFDEGTLIPVSESEIGERLQSLITSRQPSWQAHGEHWSLAGAQEKIALHQRGGHWFRATGAIPTTHIIKPGVVDLKCQAYNEVLCQTAVREVGLPTASTEYVDFAGTPALVSRRWDRRVSRDGSVVRLHQEDLCQALGASPAVKYQSEGGPSPRDIIALLRSLLLEEDIWLFVRALTVNFLLGATDAHAKNYAIIHPEFGRPRLAPFYDIASIYPYAPEPRYRRLAMKIGGRYNYDEIELRHWLAFAEANTLEPSALTAQIYLDASDLPAALRSAIEKYPPRSSDERTLASTLATAVESQCNRVLDWFVDP
ncbi:type II toxin-antitoxin system HipA family toxin [Dietzia sp. SLG310A2-38A2]|uniref:type II toxin-antitoxin system HipA family toxin n=1 Tax=Dietzia sp. SLG310A2-38A2 TaxID=1630643 RepID=UPI0015FAB695|nr:type II toxin-antitoxin system HipA family toxin [Dietzia sp. SLG310A2-38A2]MBB1029598.1 type II toxin-antitoxin system HipA family toxin [Dietzia sp. SLG310A2-38A2]